MSTKVFALVLDFKTDGLGIPLGTAPNALLAALAPIFLSRRIWLHVNGELDIELFRNSEERFGDQLLWSGERLVADDVVTRFQPQEDGLLEELRDALAPHSVDSLVMSAEGALRFRADASSEAEWHSRWRLLDPKCLLDLVTVRFQWDNEAKFFELNLSFSGYPLTSAELEADGSLDHGDPDVASANRELFFTTLARLSSALRVPAGAARWSDDGDYAPLFRRDADDIRERWLPYLNSHPKQP